MTRLRVSDAKSLPLITANLCFVSLPPVTFYAITNRIILPGYKFMVATSRIPITAL